MLKGNWKYLSLLCISVCLGLYVVMLYRYTVSYSEKDSPNGVEVMSVSNRDATNFFMKDPNREWGEYDDFETVKTQNKTHQTIEMYNSSEIITVSKPSCLSLIRGDKIEITKSLLFAGIYPYKSETDYVAETENCAGFIKKRNYITKSSDQEASFPIAYSVVMYKDVEHAERLIRAIYRPSNFYCVHVDRNAATRVHKQMESIVNCLPNVFMSSRQISVKWGQFSVLEVERICMKDLLKIPGWKYFINLTGQEFPLKTNLQIINILKILNGTNSIDAINQKKWARRWRRAGPAPHGIIPYKGNVHALVSRAFVDFAINNEKARNLTEWLKNTRIPDETFFATLDNNPELQIPGASRGQVETDYEKKPYIARFKNWGPKWGKRSFNWPCHGKRVRDVCIFGVGDLKLLTSRRELFANKFHIGFEPQTLDCIEEWHRNLTELEYIGELKTDYSFYMNLPQLKSPNN